MSTNRGIFESFPSHPADGIDSPFEVVREEAIPSAIASPFTAAAQVESPFMVAAMASQPRRVEPGRPAQVPERRKLDSPFQIAVPPESFGFDAPAASIPFPMTSQQAIASPFSVEPQQEPSLASGNWRKSHAPPAALVPQAFLQSTPAAPVATPVLQVGVAASKSNSDSFAIRQLELRAIFGADRELNSDEILQRSRALPGLRHVVRVDPQDMAGIESLKQLLPKLGLASSALKLHSDSGPLEFIREGEVMLAVQTDGDFAPGVRETLMLVARELNRLPS